MQITVFSPINGHFKKRTPLISEQFVFHRPNSGQILIKKLSKKRTGNYFLYEIVNLAFFFSPISWQLETRIEKITKLDCFLSICFKHLETLHSSSFFTASVFLTNQFTSFSWFVDLDILFERQCYFALNLHHFFLFIVWDDPANH